MIVRFDTDGSGANRQCRTTSGGVDLGIKRTSIRAPSYASSGRAAAVRVTIMAEVERPLSPHLQIYRPQITSVLSILHRLTGLALGGGALLLAWWLVAAAAGPGPYLTVQFFVVSWFGQFILLSMVWALFYHLCNGVRHLAWDLGFGFAIRTVTVSGWIVVVASLTLTAFAWFLA